MKKIALLSLIFLSVFVLLPGCGTDGDDGTAYLSYTWVFDLDYLTDDNPSIPSTVVMDDWYETRPRTFRGSYGYTGSIYSFYWEYDYTIVINEGTKAKAFSDGKDGLDIHYTLGLWSDGPELYSEEGDYSDDRNVDIFKATREGIDYLNIHAMQKTAPQKLNPPEEARIHTIHKVTGEYIFTLRYWEKQK